MDYDNKTKQYFDNYRPEMLAYLPKSAKTILDVGCSNGGFGKSLKEVQNVEVWGIAFGGLSGFMFYKLQIYLRKRFISETQFLEVRRTTKKL